MRLEDQMLTRQKRLSRDASMRSAKRTRLGAKAHAVDRGARDLDLMVLTTDRCDVGLGRELVAAKDARGQRRAREQRAVQDAGELRVEMRGAVAEQSLARLDAVELEARETEMRICRRRRLRRRQTPAQRILRGECQTSRTAQLRARLTSVPGTTCTVA